MRLRNVVDRGVVAETIGERVKRERMALGLTQRELADAVGVGVPHISKVEAGRENPSDELLRRLADVFKIDPEELLLVARRIPENLAEDLAESPAAALAFLRTWSGSKAKRP